MSAACFDKAGLCRHCFAMQPDAIRCKIHERTGRLDLKPEAPLREVMLVVQMVGSCDPGFF